MQKRGLIVDDEPAVCEMVGRVLTSAGMEALTLTKSADAPGLLSGGKFDVVFLDLHMAAPDGIELARRALEEKARDIVGEISALKTYFLH